MNRGGLDKIIMGLVIGGLVGFFVGYAVNYQSGEEAEGAGGAKVSAAGSGKPVSAKPIRQLEPSPAKGGDNPKVLLLEVSEFQCPFCSKVTATVQQVLDHYGDDVRLEFRHNPLAFHNNAQIAAQASMAAARQGKFWEMHDTLFANQKALDEDNLRKFAEELGLDMAKYDKDLHDEEIIKKIAADQAAAVALDAKGTPAFFVNGIKLSGAKPFEEFKTAIDAEIKKANAKLAAGHPADNVAYALMAENNRQAFDLFVRNLPAAEAPAPPAEVWNVRVRGDEAMKGNTTDPLVTVVEWSEFQCPFCGKIAPDIDRLAEEFGDRVRFVFKHNPLSFHDKAEGAALAALAAHAQGKFWPYHDKLFQDTKALTRPDLERYAEEVGLDMERFRKDLDEQTYLEQIKKDQADAALVKASGTPSVYVNGKKVEGNSYDGIKRLIEAELKAMDKLLDKGIARKDLYAEVIKGGKEHKEIEDAVNTFSTAGSPMIGKPGAKIIIAEFSEFQCPFCSRVGGPLKEVQAMYGDDLAVVFKHFPLNFHKDAFLAAEASMEAHAQGKFWEYHDLLFQNQKALKRDDLELYAEQIGLDMGKFRAALDQNTHKAKVNADMAEGNRAGVRGTPTVFINGRKYAPTGGFTADGFKAAIDTHILGK